MRKKFIGVYALMAVLALGTTVTSCVDDTESASVTAIRNAKVEQMQAMANLNNARAEAEKIAAEAEAAYNNAQAAYEQEMTEEAKQKFAVEIEKIKAEAEAAILEQKLNAKKYEQQLLEYADEHIRELYGKYKTALENMTSNQERKIQLTADIAKTEAGLVNVETQRDLAIAALDRNIELEKYKISLYEGFEGADIQTLQKELEKASQEYDYADDVYTVKYNAQQEAENNFDQEAQRFNHNNIVSDPIDIVKAVAEIRDKGWWSIVNMDGSYKVSENNTIPYYSLYAAETERIKQELENDVENWQNYLGKDSDTENANGSLYAQLKYWNKQKADAIAADPDADVSYYDDQIASLTAQIEDYKNIYVPNAQEELSLFNSLIAKFDANSESMKAYAEEIKAITELAEIEEKADAERLVALEARQKAQSKVEIAQALVDQTDVTAAIEACKQAIASYESQKEGWKNNVIDQETLIAQYKKELENVEAQLVAQQAVVDNLETLINNAIESKGE